MITAEVIMTVKMGCVDGGDDFFVFHLMRCPNGPNLFHLNGGDTSFEAVACDMSIPYM